jgi:hypothetical protein
MNRVARWTGFSWAQLDTGLNGDVLARAVYQNQLYAGGVFTGAPGSGGNAPSFARWSGVAWEPVLGTGLDREVRVMVPDGNTLDIGGAF